MRLAQFGSLTHGRQCSRQNQTLLPTSRQNLVLPGSATARRRLAPAEPYLPILESRLILLPTAQVAAQGSPRVCTMALKVP